MVLVAGQAGVVALLARRFVDFSSPAGLSAAVLLAGAVGTMIGVAWTGRARRFGSAVVTVLVAAGLAFGGQATARSPALADTWWPTLLLIGTGAFLALTWPRRGWMLALVILAAHIVVRWHTWTGNPRLPGLTRASELWAGSGQLVALAMSGWLAGVLCRRAATEVSAAHALAETSRSEALLAEAERMREAEVDRIVHDEVVHTLRALALAGETISLADARTAARELEDRLSTGTGSTPAPETDAENTHFLGSLRRLSPTGRLTVTHRGPRELPLPPRVRAAISAATREALRNVAQHSGAESATVETSVRELRVRVEIRDQGRGFVPDATERRGLSKSVVERLEDVGGRAEISSAPGEGTRVRLTWSPVPSHDPTVLGGGAVNALFPSLALIAAAPLALGLWFPLFVGRDVTHPWLVAGASVLVSIVGLVTMRGAGVRPVGRVESATVTAIAWVATIVNGLALPHDGGHSRLLWIPGAAAALASLLAILRPLWEAVTCGVGISVLAAVLSWRATRSTANWSLYLAPIMAPLITITLSVVVRRTGERMAWNILRAQRASTDVAVDHVAADDVHQRVERRLARHRVELESLLHQVQDPACDTGVLRSQAAALEQSFREDLMLGDGGCLRGAVAGLRSRGWSVRVRIAADLPGRLDAEVATAVATLGQAPPGGVVDLTALGGDDVWRLGLMIRPGADSATIATLHEAGWASAGLPGAIRCHRTVPTPTEASSNAATGTE